VLLAGEKCDEECGTLEVLPVTRSVLVACNKFSVAMLDAFFMLAGGLRSISAVVSLQIGTSSSLV
jgi:hypothetical protein